MCIYFESFNKIVATHYQGNFLKNAELYLAHTHISKKSETFYQHNNLVVCYFLKLVKHHNLDEIVDGLIKDLLQNNLDDNIGEFVKLLFFNAIAYHDYGKVNENFQIKKMKNRNSFFSFRNNGIDTKHSVLSAYIFIVHHFQLASLRGFSDEQKHFLNGIIYIFSYPILKHHSTVLREASSDIDFDKETQEYLKQYLPLFNLGVQPAFTNKPAKSNALGEKLKDKNIQSLLIRTKDAFSLFPLIRLNFSLLTASDYLATNEYMNQAPLNDFGVLSLERINEMHQRISQDDWINEAESKKNYNKFAFEQIEDYELTNPTVPSGDNLNILRTEMAIEVLRNIRKHYNNNLFYIEAPTGGGKTNLSALAAIELLKLNEGKYNKVFYVFPFTTLITQTYKSLKETLGLKENEMVELHSNAGMKINKENEDDNYGNEKLNYINHLFVNYPFAFLSHIRFFDILKTNEKETNYLLHRLANSIVIIDELQSYNPQHWDKVIYFIKQYADKFNIKFILMSATLPKLDKLHVIKEQVQDFSYLLPNAKAKYFNNPNFGGRVTFDFELFDRTDLSLSQIADKLLSESHLYAKKDFGTAKPLGSVYTIIEFIFKKTASEFYEIIKHRDFFDKVFVLSGTILQHRRKYIINFLKNNSNREKKILLITTQVVEAGVDIDMDIGFKDRSLIDSDEQLAGRINRNVNKKDCKLFLFNYNKEAIIYGKDKRLELTRKHIREEQYKEILNNKDFDKLYDIVLNDRNEWNDKTMVENFTDYEAKIKSLKFHSVHEGFKLIEQNNISCFVPLNVPIEVDDVLDGQKEAVFTKSEIDFLKQYQVFPNVLNEIEGKEVFAVYFNLIKNKQGFLKQKTEEKILQGIMSKFIFSLFATRDIEKKIHDFIGDPEKSQYGFKYITEWKMFYNIDTGMRDSDFNSIETQFL